MLKALRAMPGETRRIVLKPWLYRVAHNESISLLRARRPDADLDAAAHVGDEAAAGLLESRDRLRTLTSDLGELTERQRGALLMRELGGLEFAEVAEALGTTPTAVKQSDYEARWTFGVYPPRGVFDFLNGFGCHHLDLARFLMGEVGWVFASRVSRVWVSDQIGLPVTFRSESAQSTGAEIARAPRRRSSRRSSIPGYSHAR